MTVRAVLKGAGILESKDGGLTWIAHAPVNGWAPGTPGIQFLYDPAHGVNDTKTWLYTSEGYWRTTDAGANWTKVSDAYSNSVDVGKSLDHHGATAPPWIPRAS